MLEQIDELKCGLFEEGQKMAAGELEEGPKSVSRDLLLYSNRAVDFEEFLYIDILESLLLGDGNGIGRRVSSIATKIRGITAN
jgi:hypothetical protein